MRLLKRAFLHCGGGNVIVPQSFIKHKSGPDKKECIFLILTHASTQRFMHQILSLHIKIANMKAPQSEIISIRNLGGGWGGEGGVQAGT